MNRPYRRRVLVTLRTWLDVIVGVSLAIAGFVTLGLVPEMFWNVTLPICAALLIVYVWVTRSRLR